MALNFVRLGVNVDHIATIRNARGGPQPDPVLGAWEAIKAGADGITAHLREDRRHINDDDLNRLQLLCSSENIPLNMEMAATKEMLDIALILKPKSGNRVGSAIPTVVAFKAKRMYQIGRVKWSNEERARFYYNL